METDGSRGVFGRFRWCSLPRGQVNQAIPSFISSASGPASAPLPVVPAANLRYSEKPELKRLEMLEMDGNDGT